MNIATANLIGNGLKFDGVNDFVSLPYSINIANDHSFSFWINGNITNNQRLLVSYNSNFVANGGFSIFYGGGEIVGISLTSPTMSTDGSFVYCSILNGLHHVVIVKENQTKANWKIYVDGISQSLTNGGAFAVATGTMTGSNMFLGKQETGGFYFEGTQYDLKIFNKALSQSEVTQLYNSFSQDLTGLTSNLVANYDFNQKSGTTLKDSSSNGYDGTLSNFASTSLGSNNAWVNSLGGSIIF